MSAITSSSFRLKKKAGPIRKQGGNLSSPLQRSSTNH
jgi:hypothetical protein